MTRSRVLGLVLLHGLSILNLFLEGNRKRGTMATQLLSPSNLHAAESTHCLRFFVSHSASSNCAQISESTRPENLTIVNDVSASQGDHLCSRSLLDHAIFTDSCLKTVLTRHRGASRIEIGYKPGIQCDLACRTKDGKDAFPSKPIIGWRNEDPTSTLVLDRTNHRITRVNLKLKSSDSIIVKDLVVAICVFGRVFCHPVHTSIG